MFILKVINQLRDSENRILPAEISELIIRFLFPKGSIEYKYLFEPALLFLALRWVAHYINPMDWIFRIRYRRGYIYSHFLYSWTTFSLSRFGIGSRLLIRRYPQCLVGLESYSLGLRTIKLPPYKIISDDEAKVAFPISQYARVREYSRSLEIEF